MQTIRTMLEASTKAYPEHIALQLGHATLTYRQLQDQVVSTVFHLKKEGITSGDKVALLFQNTIACAVGFLALAWLHAHVVPLEPEITSNELTTIFRDIPFSAVIGMPAKLGQFGQFASEHHYASIGLVERSAPPQAVHLEDEALGATEGVFLYHYTSGSTGKPKAALHSQANLVMGGYIYQQTYHITPTDSILLPIPLFHSFGMIGGFIASLLSGARLVLVERFIPHQLVQMLAEERISLLLAVPLMYDLIARCALRNVPDLSRLRACLCSGGPLPQETANRFSNRYHLPIYQVYGSTETGVIATQWPGECSWPQGSIGRPLMGVSVRILDEEGQKVLANQVGGLLIKTETMFMGYLNAPDVMAEILQDGWYITGDMAKQDAEGNLYLIGRKNTFINVGGRKVNPLQIEEVLLSHSMVQEALVYGCETSNASESIQAAVVAVGSPSAEELLAFCREQLPAYKVPATIEFVAELPKTSMGKLLRPSSHTTALEKRA